MSWKPTIAPRRRWPWEYLFRHIEFFTKRPGIKTIAFLRIVEFEGGQGKIVPGQSWTFGIDNKADFNGTMWTEAAQKTLRVKKPQDIKYLVALSVNGQETFICPASLKSVKDIISLLEDAANRDRRYKNQIWS